MASDKSFAEFVVDQMQAAGVITSRKMFGEYAVYCDGKVVALICDNKLFVKKTDGGRKFIESEGDVIEAPAYPGAKPSFLIEDEIENQDWICALIQITARELPAPKEKK